MAGKFRLTWFTKRNTPKVTKPSEPPPKATEATGKVVKSRLSTTAEEQKMKGGKWLRVDAKGKSAGQSGYKGKTSKGNGPSKAASKKAVANRKKKK